MPNSLLLLKLTLSPELCQIKEEFSMLNVPLDSFLVPKLGNGCNISFWNDVWLGDTPLKEKFPRLFILDTNVHSSVQGKRLHDEWIWTWRRNLRYDTEQNEFQHLLFMLRNISLSDMGDSWSCNVDSNGIFSVKGVRGLLEDKILVMDRKLFSWNNWVPIKLNILTWRVLLNRMPTKLNLRNRGVAVVSHLCIFCHGEENLVYICLSHALLQRLYGRVFLPGVESR